MRKPRLVPYLYLDMLVSIPCALGIQPPLEHSLPFSSNPVFGILIASQTFRGMLVQVPYYNKGMFVSRSHKPRILSALEIACPDENSDEGSIFLRDAESNALMELQEKIHSSAV